MDARTVTSARTASSRPLIAGLLLAFLLGGAVAGYGVYRFVGGADPAAPLSGDGIGLRAVRPSPTAAASAMATMQAQHGGIDQRLAAAEQRIARLDLQAQAVSGNTARAEALLIAFAARRTLEKGAELGYLADQLQLRFGDAQPNAVKTLLGFSRRPVTRDQLLARLEGLSPRLAEAGNLPAWDRVGVELSQLFVIRRQNAPSPQPQRRLERARMFLESGRTAEAIAEVRNLPGAGEAKSWVADAQRYTAAQDALDRIETTAVLEPRTLRDGSGGRVEQLSPLQE